MPRANQGLGGVDGDRQPNGDRSASPRSSRTRIRPRAALAVVAVLALAGLTVFVLQRRSSQTPIPRIDETVHVAPEVQSLVRDLSAELQRDANNHDRWGRLGMAFEANGLLAPAHEAYRGATRVAPGEPRWWYRLAMVQARTGTAEDGLISLRKAIELRPDYAPAQWRLGLWLLDADDTTGAERAFSRASELNPSDPAGAVGLGRVCLQRSENERAAQVLERALARTPGDRYAMHLLGTAYSRLGRREEAAFALAIGVGSEPAWPDPWTDDMIAFRRGFAVRLKDATQHFLNGQTAPAIDILESLQRERPQDTALLSHLGEVYVAANRPEDGIRVLEQVVARDPERYGAYIPLANGYLQQQRLADAGRAIDRAIELNPTLSRAYETKGLIYWRAGDEASARAMLERAVRLDPRAVRAMVWLGMLELNLSNFQAAEASFTRATRLDPVRVDAWVGKANAAMALGRREEAAAALARASELAPDAREVTEALARLRSQP